MKKSLTTLSAVLLSYTFSVAQSAYYDLPKIERGMLGTVIYSILGLIMMILAIKVIDWLTPGKLMKQLAEDKNIALAIFTGAAVLGICIIIASAIAS